jgi:dTMP kinase
MNANTLGKFITIEGQDGAGKSTNIAVIESVLQHKSIPFIHTREPGGTELGEILRDILLNGKNTDGQTLDICDNAELLLIFAARAQHLNDVILPAIQSGKWVVCDRFTDATYAYQGGGRGLNISTIEALEKLVQGSFRPDLTLMLDLPIDVGAQRAGERSQPDRFEIEKNEFKQRVRKQYLELAEKESQRISLIDANQSVEKVATQIKQCLERFILQS